MRQVDKSLEALEKKKQALTARIEKNLGKAVIRLSEAVTKVEGYKADLRVLNGDMVEPCAKKAPEAETVDTD